MIDYIKAKLLEDPEKIKELLESFGYCHVIIRSTYISFGRDEQSSSKSLVCRIKDNPNLICTDYARNLTLDIFNLIIKQRSVGFREVITATKNILGIDGWYYQESVSTAPFGGLYAKLKHRTNQELKVYDDNILDKYVPCGNERFLRDYISLEAQRHFEVGYDIESQSITIPIRNEAGNLVGVKCRRNCDDSEQKYWYDVPCQMSQLLYGYCQNYEYLESADIIYVFESEKSVMAAHSYDVKNTVALGSGSISRKQVQLLLSLNPKKIVLLHDNLYSLEAIMRNVEMIKGYLKFKEVEIGYWDYFGKGYEGKVSPTDLGRDKFLYILDNEIKYIERNNE